MQPVFFWRQDNAAYLITNWHVVTGRNPFTGESMMPNRYFPERLRYWAGQWDLESIPNGVFFSRTETTIDIFDDIEKGIWLEHPTFQDKRIDMVAIPISYNPVIREDKFNTFVNEYPYVSLYHSTGCDVFITGYPYRNYRGMMIPIWKRGSLAAEPLFPIDNKPMFLVDALTAPGMSGSPVFRRVFGPVAKADGSMQVDAVVTTEFVGVYSGRMLSKNLEHTALGISWYANLIPEIISLGQSRTRASLHDF